MASDQGLHHVSLMNIYSEHFCPSLCSFNLKYYHEIVKTADLGGHCLFLYKAGFCSGRFLNKMSHIKTGGCLMQHNIIIGAFCNIIELH